MKIIKFKQLQQQKYSNFNYIFVCDFVSCLKNTPLRTTQTDKSTIINCCNQFIATKPTKPTKNSAVLNAQNYVTYATFCCKPIETN